MISLEIFFSTRTNNLVAYDMLLIADCVWIRFVTYSTFHNVFSGMQLYLNHYPDKIICVISELAKFQ